MPNQNSTASYLKAFNILFFAMLAGQLLFAVISYFVATSRTYNPPAYDLLKPLMFVVPFFCMAAVLSGYFMYKQRIPGIKAESDLSEKLAAYRALYIIRFALIEFAVIFAIIAYLLTIAQEFIVFAGLSILSFLTLKPSKDKLVKELELGWEEME